MAVKRFVLFALVLTLSLAFAACSAADDGINTTDPNRQNETSDSGDSADPPEETAEQYELEVFDWNQRTFNILVNDDPPSVWSDIDFTSAEEEIGEPLNDAVYMRNALIEEIFSVKVNIIPGTRDQHVGLIRTAVNAGDHAYDIAFNTPRENYTLFQEGLLVDLFGINSLDLDAYFWDGNAANDLSVMNRLYMVTGDISVMPKRSLSALMFNKQLIVDFGYASPYDYLKNDTWTLDRFVQMCKDHGNNIDTPLDIPSADRKFSIITFNDMMPLTLLGAGVQFAGKNSDDIPEITFWSEKTVSAFNKLSEIMFDTRLTFNWQVENLGIPQISETKFMRNESLFYWAELRNIEQLRGMDSDFGILPVPKYDENQTGYVHTVNPWVAMLMAVPVRGDDNLERIGAVTNAFAKLGHDMLIPAYYDVTLQRKLSRDDESELSIDIILANMRYDQGYMYNWGNIGGFTLNLKPDALASSYERISVAAERDLHRMIDNLLD